MESSDQLENILGQLGNFGKYQFIQHALHSLAWLTAGVHMMSFVFVFPILEHRCYIEDVDYYEGNASVHFPGAERYIPKTPKGDLDSCRVYGENNDTFRSCEQGYIYASEYFNTSRITDFDMVCDRRWMRALLQSIFLSGTLIGAFACGQLADKFGRKPVFCISSYLQFVFGVTGAFLNHYFLMAINMFFYGLFGGSGAVVPSVALTMEVVGAKARGICGTMFTVCFGVGAIMVAGWAYLLPVAAHHLQCIYALHSVLLFGHLWFMDESIRWLWTNNQQEEAIKIAEKAVRINGGKFSCSPATIPPQHPHDIQMVEINLDSTQENSTPPTSDPQPLPKKESARPEDSKSVSYSVLDLFRYPKLRKRTLVMLYCWFASNVAYFGLSFNSVNLFGNPFLMFIINILMEVPGHILSIFVVLKTGNKPIFSGSLLLTGLACVVVGLFPGGLVMNIITMLAKVAATVAFNVINSYTAELFPTCLRNTAIGLCIMAARSGAAIIPEINLLSVAAEEIPSITFGTVGVLAGLFSLFMLPETQNQPIHETIEDVEKSSKQKTTPPSVESQSQQSNNNF